MNKKHIRTVLALSVAAGIALSGSAGFSGSAKAAAAPTPPAVVPYSLTGLSASFGVNLNDLLNKLQQGGFNFNWPGFGTVITMPMPTSPTPTAPTPPVIVKPTPTPTPPVVVKPTPTPTPPVVVQPTPTPPVVKPTPAPVSTPAPGQGSGQQGGSDTSSYAQQVINLVNQERSKQGLGALTSDTLLTKVAVDKAKDMYTNNYFDHNSPTYGSPFDMMKAYGVTYSYAGENIAKGQPTPQEVMTAWMNSEGHRANILKTEYTKIGVAYYNGEWVQEFKG